MEIVQVVDKDSMSTKRLAQATSRPDVLHFEPMTEYRGTRDDADLARFGKKQQFEVYSLIPRSLVSHALLTFLLAEKLWPFVYHRPDLHLDDHMGGHAEVSQVSTLIFVSDR